MQQELEQIIKCIGLVAAAVPAGLSFSAFHLSVLFYLDAKRDYSLTDSTRQQALGKPKFVEILKQNVKNIPTIFGIGKENYDYHHKYFSAYSESKEEQENNRFIGYRKIKEE